MDSCFNCIHCTREEAEPMYYCFARLVDDGFGNGDTTPCQKFVQKQSLRWDKPFGGEILREEDGLGHIDTDGD